MKKLESLKNFNAYAIDEHMQKSIVGLGSCSESRCATSDGNNCDAQITVTRDDDQGNTTEAFQYTELCAENV